jgi:putative transposase
LNYFAKIYRIVCVAVPPHFTSQDCSVCGTRVQKTLSNRTHQCPNCQTVLDRDHNAAINILKKGLKYLGNHLNASTSLGIDTELVEVSTILLGKQKPTQTPWESPTSRFSVETLRI